MGFLSSWFGVSLGLGGGVMFNPIQLSYGINPIVGGATSTCMMMHTTFAATIMYVYEGAYDYAWLGWFMIWCGIGVIVG